MLIFHGDNHVLSRDQLNQQLQHLRHQGIKEIIRLDGLHLKLETVIQALESPSFFATDRWLVIDNLFSRPASKQKQAIISYLKSAQPIPLILWEDRLIPISQLKPFSTQPIFTFKLDPLIFRLLDSLQPNLPPRLLQLSQQCYRTTSPPMTFYLLCRRLSQLIAAKKPAALTAFKLQSWQLKKLTNQAHLFSLDQLLNAHHYLFQIDSQLKTGLTLLTLPQQLDLFLLSL